MNFIYISFNQHVNEKKIYKIATELKLPCMAIWKYPESNLQLKSLYKHRCYFVKKIEPVTTYQNSNKYQKNALVSYDKKFIRKLISTYVGNELDSLAFYRSSSSKWKMCYIMHERMIILRYSKKYEKKLTKLQISYSLKPPKHW